MKEILERFKTEKLAVNCQTEEEAKQFVKLCYENGIEWHNCPDTETLFNKYLINTCYVYLGDLLYCNKAFIESIGYKCLAFQDFMKESSEYDFKLEMKPLQRRNYERLLEALRVDEITESERKSLVYLANEEDHTIINLCAMIKNSRGVE